MERQAAFSKEGWMFWRENFRELASMDVELGEEARAVVKEAELMMNKIENGDMDE